MMLPLYYVEGDELVPFECPHCKYMEHIQTPTDIMCEYGIPCPQCTSTITSSYNEVNTWQLKYVAKTSSSVFAQ